MSALAEIKDLAKIYRVGLLRKQVEGARGITFEVRPGLGAGLVAEPELLGLDEPVSGLDPLGRRDVRELSAEERASGRKVLFSSHVLSDVEALCDRVVILQEGKVVVARAVRDLVRR